MGRLPKTSVLTNNGHGNLQGRGLKHIKEFFKGHRLESPTGKGN